MNRIRVAAGVITDNDKVLITRRAPKENFAGGWEFPIGKNIIPISKPVVKGKPPMRWLRLPPVQNLKICL